MPKPKAGEGKKPEVVPRERKPDGHVKPGGSVEDGGIAPTLLKRLKDDVIPLAKDRRLGTVLGVMHLQGILSEAETEAGFCYAEDVGAYERIMGHLPRSSASPSFEFGRKGADSLDLEHLKRMDPEAAEKAERRIKRRKKSIQKRYDRTQMYIPHFPILISSIVEEVCCNDRPVHSLHHPMLKKILRNLAERCYGLVQGGGETQARRRPTSRRTDAVAIADATVDAMAHWFSRRDGTITSFRLAVSRHPSQPLGITAYGHTGFGEVLEHTIRIKRSGLMAEAINAQLLKAAEAKGWPEVKIEPKGEAA